MSVSVRLTRAPIETLAVDDLRFAVRLAGAGAPSASASPATAGCACWRRPARRRASSRAPCAPSCPGCAASSPSSRPWGRLRRPDASWTASACRIWADLRAASGRRPCRPCGAAPRPLRTETAHSTAPPAARWCAGTTERGRVHIAARVAHFAPLAGGVAERRRRPRPGHQALGACDGRTGVVTFHWELMLQRPEAVDYVVPARLAHLHEAHHQRAFWRRVEAVMPDWKARRALLAGAAERHPI